MNKLFKWFLEKNKLIKELEALNIENNALKDKNKKCQENINRTNSYWKGMIRTKK